MGFYMWGFAHRGNKRVYLDYAAATPVSEEVASEMSPYWSHQFANPSAIHREGVAARRAIETAREQLARKLGVRSEGVIFTGSGTESNNIAIAGTLEHRHAAGTAYADMEVLTTAIEHPSVREVLRAYEARGVTVRMLPVDEFGRVVQSELAGCLSKRTVLVTVGYVNSEIGTIQPLSAIGRAVRAFEKEHSVRIVFHSDAAQAPLWLPCQFPALGIDALSLDAGKCYGPKGVGVLVLKHGVSLKPVMYGGGQELGLRSGTEATPLIVGAVQALLSAQSGHVELAARVSRLRDQCIKACLAIDGVVLNGSPKERVANNVNISMSGVEAEFAVISLDAAGFAVATKSACSGKKGGGSEVIRATSGDQERSETSLRITLGRATTASEIDSFVKALSAHIGTTRTAQASLTRK